MPLGNFKVYNPAESYGLYQEGQRNQREEGRKNRLLDLKEETLAETKRSNLSTLGINLGKEQRAKDKEARDIETHAFKMIGDEMQANDAFMEEAMGKVRSAMELEGEEYNKAIFDIMDMGGQQAYDTLSRQDLPEDQKHDMVEKYQQGVLDLFSDKENARQTLTKEGFLDEDGSGVEIKTRERKIADYMENLGMTRPEAIKHADKMMKLGTDEMGRSVVVDVAESSRKDLFGNKDVSTEEDTTPKPIITPEEAMIGTGPMSNLRQAVNNMFGFAFKGIPAPRTEEARNNLRIFNQSIKPMMMVSDRGAIYEQKNIEKLLPNPETFFQDPDAAAQKLDNLKDLINTQIEMKQRLLNTGDLNPKTAKDMQDDIAQLKVASGLFEAPQDTKVDYMNMSIEDLKSHYSNLSQNDIKNMSDEDAEVLLNRIESGE